MTSRKFFSIKKSPSTVKKGMEGQGYSITNCQCPFQPLGAVFKGNFLLIKDTIIFPKSQYFDKKHGQKV